MKFHHNPDMEHSASLGLKKMDLKSGKADLLTFFAFWSFQTLESRNETSAYTVFLANYVLRIKKAKYAPRNGLLNSTRVFFRGSLFVLGRFLVETSSLQTGRWTSYRDAKKIRKEHTSAWNFDSFSTPNSTTFIMPIIFLSSIKRKLKQGIHKKFQDHQRFNSMIFFNMLLWP